MPFQTPGRDLPEELYPCNVFPSIVHTFHRYFVLYNINYSTFHFPDPSLQVFDGVPVTQELVTQLLEDVSIDWKMIGRHLNIKEAVLRTIDDENRRVRNKAMEMFDAWMKNNSRNAIVPVLVTALNKTGRRDLGERVEGT